MRCDFTGAHVRARVRVCMAQPCGRVVAGLRAARHVWCHYFDPCRYFTPLVPPLLHIAPETFTWLHLFCLNTDTKSNKRVMMWDCRHKRIITGNAAPRKCNAMEFLSQHPHTEVYLGQDLQINEPPNEMVLNSAEDEVGHPNRTKSLFHIENITGTM